MQLTRQRAIQEHRKMWNWIANESERLRNPVDKNAYLHKFFNHVYLTNECFLCDYSFFICNNESFGSDAKKMCDYCPLSWSASGKERCMSNDYDGYYDLWEKAYIGGDYIEAARLARIIANLPEKQE